MIFTENWIWHYVLIKHLILSLTNDGHKFLSKNLASRAFCKKKAGKGCEPGLAGLRKPEGGTLTGKWEKKGCLFVRNERELLDSGWAGKTSGVLGFPWKKRKLILNSMNENPHDSYSCLKTINRILSKCMGQRRGAYIGHVLRKRETFCLGRGRTR